jgi:hypothetical protein
MVCTFTKNEIIAVIFSKCKKMELPEISLEQNNVIQQLLLNKNVVVDSVAGSGKTTCNLHIAKHFNRINILLLTYNARLKSETREKVKRMELDNIEVHSYHSFCVKYYNRYCYNDTVINQIIKNEQNPLENFNFDLIVLDESQDITRLYYELICKLCKDNKNNNLKLCIFGDKKQSIYDFNDADQRYIEYASELFNFNCCDWERCNLSVSFRITDKVAAFVNNCLLKQNRIIANKTSIHKPRYIICDCFGDTLGMFSRTFDEIKYYFDMGYSPSDIFILAPSVKSQKTPVRILENKIKRELPNVMVYVPTSDDEKLDEQLLKGKLIFSTFHQTKGLERKVAIVFNFDNSYFEYYNKNSNRYICPNEIYVATTRCIEHLTLFHHYNNDYLQFIDTSLIQLHCYFEIDMFDRREPKKIRNINTSVTDVIRHIPQHIIDECYNQLEITVNNEYIYDKINIPLTVTNSKTVENVSEITGIAIPCIFELKNKRKIDILDTLLEANFEQLIKIKDDDRIQKCSESKTYDINNININRLTVDELLYIANCWNTMKNGYLFKIYQIDNYDWLSQEKLNKCVDRLQNLNISPNSLFEYKQVIENEIELLNRRLIGYIDCVDEDNNTVYEFKCVQQLEKEHYLQLALYMYMYELNKEKHVKDIVNNHNVNNMTVISNSHIVELLRCEKKLKKKIKIVNKALDEYKKNAVCKNVNDIAVGDIIKYSMVDDVFEMGEIVKIYKTTGKVKVKNSCNGKNLDVPKTSIICVVDLALQDIEHELLIHNTHLNDTYEAINNAKYQTQTEMDLKSLKKCDVKTKYVLYNILTNECASISCDFQKLKEIVKYLIYSKYTITGQIPDCEFIANNKSIRNNYFT